MNKHPYDENEPEPCGIVIDGSVSGSAVDGLFSCPFCGIRPEPFDGDYVIYHKAKCFLKTESGNQYIVGQRARTAWNTRVV